MHKFKHASGLTDISETAQMVEIMHLLKRFAGSGLSAKHCNKLLLCAAIVEYHKAAKLPGLYNVFPPIILPLLPL